MEINFHFLWQCIPLTWNSLNGVHYCFFYWNILMWISWSISVKRDPGFLPTNTENYAHIIRGVSLSKFNFFSVIISFFMLLFCFRYLSVKREYKKIYPSLNYATHVAVFGHYDRNIVENAIAVLPISIIIALLLATALELKIGYFKFYYPQKCKCLNKKLERIILSIFRSWFFVFLLCLAVNSTFSLYFNIHCISYVGCESFLVLSLFLSLIMACFSWVRTAIAVSNSFEYVFICLGIESAKPCHESDFYKLRFRCSVLILTGSNI